MLLELRASYWQYRPTTHLFEGAGKQPYSASSLMKIIKRAAYWAKAQKRVTPHQLRHSFATAPAALAFVGRRYRVKIY